MQRNKKETYSEKKIRLDKKGKKRLAATAWKKGQSGNPAGGALVPVDIKRGREMIQNEFKRLCIQNWQSIEKEIDDILDPKSKAPMGQKIVARLFKQASLGDDVFMKELLNRTLGKVKEEFDVTAKGQITFIDLMKAYEIRSKRQEKEVEDADTE